MITTPSAWKRHYLSSTSTRHHWLAARADTQDFFHAFLTAQEIERKSQSNADIARLLREEELK
jgi:hypothetical protein